MASIYVTGGGQKASHIHSLIRLGPEERPYRYIYKACGEKLKAKSGVLIDDLKAMITKQEVKRG